MARVLVELDLVWFCLNLIEKITRILKCGFWCFMLCSWIFQYEEKTYAKTWIFLTPYVCTERIFDSRSFMYNNIFLKKLLEKLVAIIYTLLLAHFVFKLVNYSKLSEILNFRKNSKSTSFSFENSDFTVFIHFSKNHFSNNWPIWTQKVQKEA